MLEAIASSAMNASAVRVDTDKVSSLRSAAVTASTTPASKSAPYYSPFIIVDSNFNKAILAIRDSNTGSVTQQYPSKSQIRAYVRAQQVQSELSESIAQTPAPLPGVSSAQQQPVELPENLQPTIDKVAAEAQAAIASRGNVDAAAQQMQVAQPAVQPQQATTRVMLDA